MASDDSPRPTTPSPSNGSTPTNGQTSSNGNGRKHGGAPRAHRLSHIVRMLSKTPEVRSDLVADIEQQLEDDTYLSEEKLDLAIYRMLKDILA